MSFLPDLRLVLHIGDVVNRNKRLRVLAVDEGHQPLVLAFIDDGDDLVMFLQIVCADGFVDRGAAVQLVDDELPQHFLFFGVLFLAVIIIIFLKLRVKIFKSMGIILLVLSLILFISGIISMSILGIIPYILFYVGSQILNYIVLFISNDVKK